LQHSTKDERHRGNYKTLENHVAAFDASGKQLGIVFVLLQLEKPEWSEVLS
jgi:hypothetical protein